MFGARDGGCYALDAASGKMLWRYDAGSPVLGSPALAGRSERSGAVNDAECVSFLQWALPQMGFRWAGFRKVRRQVCRRINRRMGTIGLTRVSEYRRLLEEDRGEWDALYGMCHITISRFYRDRAVFDALREAVLPRAAKEVLETGGDEFRAWSAGCEARRSHGSGTRGWASTRLQRGDEDLLQAALERPEVPQLDARINRGTYDHLGTLGLPEQHEQA